MKALFEFLLVAVLPAAAGYGGYALTELVFRKRFIPLPFESSGLAIGAGCFFWTLAILTLWVGMKRKK